MGLLLLNLYMKQVFLIFYFVKKEFLLLWELINDTKNYIDGGCVDTDYVSKYKKLGDSTGFFFKKTIYRVKK